MKKENRNTYTALNDLFKENQIELNSFDWALNDIENAQELFNYLHDNSFLDVEIIYYSKAIQYLKENDPSLCDSLELASEWGYELKNINSELLASLLATQKLFESLAELDEEITEIFNEFLNA